MKSKLFQHVAKQIGACAVAFAMFSCGVESENSTLKETIPADEGAAALGAGYDSISGQIRGDCVKRTAVESSFGATGQALVKFNLEKVETESDLQKYLSVSANASFGSNVSASAEFSRETHIHDYSVFIVAKVTVLNAKERMRDVELKESAFNLLANEGEFAFRTRCGDGFIVGQQMGGEMISVIELKTKSNKHKQRISAEIAGSYGMFSGDAEFERRLRKVVRSESLNITVLKRGGQIETLQLGPNELIQASAAFPSSVDNSSSPITAEVLDYETLQLPAGSQLFEFSQQKLVIGQLAQNKSVLVRSLQNMDYILQNADQFEPFDRAGLVAQKNTVHSEITKINKAAQECFAEPENSCVVPSDLGMLQITLPKRNEDEPAPVVAVIDCKKPHLYDVASADFVNGCKPLKFKRGTGAVCGVHRVLVAMETTNQSVEFFHKSALGPNFSHMNFYAGNSDTGCWMPISKTPFYNKTCLQACKSRRYDGYERGTCTKNKTCEHGSFGVKEWVAR